MTIRGTASKAKTKDALPRFATTTQHNSASRTLIVLVARATPKVRALRSDSLGSTFSANNKGSEPAIAGAGEIHLSRHVSGSGPNPNHLRVTA